MAIPYTRKEVSINYLFYFLLFYLITLLRTRSLGRAQFYASLVRMLCYYSVLVFQALEDLTNRRDVPRGHVSVLPPFNWQVTLMKSRTCTNDHFLRPSPMITQVGALAWASASTQVPGIILESECPAREYLLSVCNLLTFQLYQYRPVSLGKRGFEVVGWGEEIGPAPSLMTRLSDWSSPSNPNYLVTRYLVFIPTEESIWIYMDLLKEFKSRNRRSPRRSSDQSQ